MVTHSVLKIEDACFRRRVQYERVVTEGEPATARHLQLFQQKTSESGERDRYKSREKEEEKTKGIPSGLLPVHKVLARVEGLVHHLVVELAELDLGRCYPLVRHICRTIREDCPARGVQQMRGRASKR